MRENIYDLFKISKKVANLQYACLVLFGPPCTQTCSLTEPGISSMCSERSAKNSDLPDNSKEVYYITKIIMKVNNKPSCFGYYISHSFCGVIPLDMSKTDFNNWLEFGLCKKTLPDLLGHVGRSEVFFATLPIFEIDKGLLMQVPLDSSMSCQLL